MRACVINIGDEILSGQIVNTNAAYLSCELSNLGFDITLQIVASDFDLDNFDRITSLAASNELIVISGGLGPTVDDLTRDLMAKLSSSELMFDNKVFHDLFERYGENAYHRIQSMIPEKATKLKNSVGQAPGLVIKYHNTTIVALPGVPHEMKTIFKEELLPFLRREFSNLNKYHEKTIHLFDLIETEVDPYLKKFQENHPNVIFGIYPSYGTLKIVLKSQSKQELDQIEKFLFGIFKNHIFHTSNQKIEGAIFDLLKKRQLTIALAESITGGEISSRLVSMPGISQVFLGSFVVYSDELKTDLLGIHPSILTKFGAVSSETCDLMLAQVLSKTKADVAISVTGIAGPDGGSFEKPVGLVYIGCALRGQKPSIHKCEFKGDRAMIIEKAATFAFGYLYQYLLSHI